MLYFFKKIKKNTWRYHYFAPAYQKYWWYYLQFLRYRLWQTDIGNFWSFFAHLPHPKNQKNLNFEKIKTLLEIWLFFTSVPKTTIIWGMFPKIRRQTEVFVIFGHFLFFYPTNNPENQIFQKMSSFYTWVPKITIIWCMLPEIWSATNIIFCHFDPPNNLKNKNFEKIKKMPGDIIILHKCTLNDNHMRYGYRDMKSDWQNFLSFWSTFCPFTLPRIQKIQNLKK